MRISIFKKKKNIDSKLETILVNGQKQIKKMLQLGINIPVAMR